jgi:hypothetical protein
MRRYDRRVALVKNGRVVPVTLPERSEYYGVEAVGWVVDDGR